MPVTADEKLRNLANWPGAIGPPANLVIDAYLEKIEELGIKGKIMDLDGHKVVDLQWIAQIAKRLQ